MADIGIEESGVVVTMVYRPAWMEEGHEDWDDLTEW